MGMFVAGTTRIPSVQRAGSVSCRVFTVRVRSSDLLMSL